MKYFNIACPPFQQLHPYPNSNKSKRCWRYKAWYILIYIVNFNLYISTIFQYNWVLPCSTSKFAKIMISLKNELN